MGVLLHLFMFLVLFLWLPLFRLLVCFAPFLFICFYFILLFLDAGLFSNEREQEKVLVLFGREVRDLGGVGEGEPITRIYCI